MALEGPARPIRSPEEELAYLRAEVLAKEQELASLRVDKPRETVIHERILHHAEQPGHQVLDSKYQMKQEEKHELALNLEPRADDETMEELRKIIETKGIHNAFGVLEKLKNPHLEDDFHRFLVQYLLAGMPLGMNEKQPEWKGLHMTLYEVSLPEANADDESRRKSLKELISAMEQFYSGMLATEHAVAGEPAHFTLELAVPVNKAHLMFYAAVPNTKRDLFEKQLLAIFPSAHIAPQPNDYNIFTNGGASFGSVAALGRPGMLPLKDYGDFDYDPINSILNAFAKIAPEGEGASLQIVIAPQGDRFIKHYRKVLSALRSGETSHTAFHLPESFLGEAARDITKTFFSKQKTEDDSQEKARQIESNKGEIEHVERKLAAQIVATNMRLVVSSMDGNRAEQILGELESAFHQFENPTSNRIEWKRVSRNTQRTLFHDFTFRTFEKGSEVPLSIKELTTIFHFPPSGIASSPHLKQSRFTAAAAPLELPHEGIQLGTNTYRGQDTDVLLAPEDRLRHLYVIGQTGTGKTSFMKTLIEQDIKAGNGVCFIDPHGNDILDVLACVPPERYEDVIYFDPAYLDRPFGLNLLEYDPAFPEQKTFIVNELLAIFRRLYGDVPESMGPAFEQYFRNATLLVMEDPASGSTLMDIGRVLSNKDFRDLKLSRSMNPVVNQFWNEIASQAEGEASLANIVPYITNKFDDFTANDFMRPIIGQQESSFNFRDIMDKRKILLVNLSKGRLGERNANLIGLIMVGKLFMAALSRADDPRAVFPPFYVYIDEFQNITTDSIPAILSEARKYKLSMTMAHQFLAQVDEKTRDAVFGNVGSMAVFRVGQEDGEFFAKQFAPTFSAPDFINIENYNAYVRMLANGVPQKPFNIHSLKPVEGNQNQIDDLRELSYLTYGRDRATVEGAIRAKYLS
ncbi:MAG: putative Type IV secretory pathway VirD4 component [Parcubacteria bacterium C7867-007]|nr:MAG: putative Type IV secretory pathway VirD4 component [Parcubacteria bacterium C7867-007]